MDANKFLSDKFISNKPSKPSMIPRELQMYTPSSMQTPQLSTSFDCYIGGYSCRTPQQRAMFRLYIARLNKLKKQQPMNRQLTLQVAIDQIKGEWKDDLRRVFALDERTEER